MRVTWEYKWAPTADPENLVRVLNEYGADGWEMVTTDYGGVIFKRPVTPEPRWAP